MSGGWAWLGALSSMHSSSCAHPRPPGRAGRPVGGSQWEGSGASEPAEMEEEGRGGWRGPEAALPLCLGSGGATLGRTPEANVLAVSWPLAPGRVRVP